MILIKYIIIVTRAVKVTPLLLPVSETTDYNAKGTSNRNVFVFLKVKS